jgi:hypothetical protein
MVVHMVLAVADIAWDRIGSVHKPERIDCLVEVMPPADSFGSSSLAGCHLATT